MLKIWELVTFLISRLVSAILGKQESAGGRGETAAGIRSTYHVQTVGSCKSQELTVCGSLVRWVQRTLGLQDMVFPRNNIDSLPIKTCYVFQCNTGGGVRQGKERENPLANIIHQTIPSRFPRGFTSWRY